MGRSRVIGLPAPVLVLTDTRTGSTSFSGTKTYINVPIGAASVDRLVICVNSAALTAPSAVASATIGGVAASLYQPVTGVNRNIVFFWAKVPTGTTATIVVNWSGGDGAAAENLITYVLKDHLSDTPNAQNAHNSSSLNVATLALSGVEQDAAIIIGAIGPGTTVVTFNSPVTATGSLGVSNLHKLSYGQVDGSAPGTVNLTFTSAPAVSAMAWR
jgi:hypothetical protein